MRPTPLSAFAAALLLAVSSLPAAAVNIGDLHINTSSGVQNNPYAVGTTVTVTGVVSAGDGSFSGVNNEVAVQDTTGGIVVFRSGGIGLGFHYNLGDSVTVTGQIAQFNGLTEISNASIVQTYSSGNFGLLTPLVLTCKQVRDSTFDFDTFKEPNEGRLIRINNVTVTGGTWPSVCGGVNTNLTITDATGSCTLFIDKDGTACGSSNPSGPFDVIGILYQFKSSAPFTTGYEIHPRGAFDIIPLTPGPNFVGVPQAVNVDSVSADIQWGTDAGSSSIVEYGTTTAYGTTVGDSTLVTAHTVHLTGLSPNHLYHYRVTSLDAQGGRQTGDYSFSTPSNVPGQMNFYFNKSIDASLANPDTAQGNADLQARMVAFINRATKSIDMAMYSFNAPPVTAALQAKADAGVKVRFIMEATNSQTEASKLTSHGIPWITSTYGGNHADGGIMHNKFIVVDGRDADPLDDWLWTGSVNATTTQFTTDSNNGLEIQDFGLAQCYETEFNEMWGSSGDAPNSANSRMGSRKTDNTPHFFHVNGIPIEIYFAPSDGNEAKYTGYIAQADYGIDFTILSFTSNPIEEAMRARWNGVPGFYLRGVFDQGSLGDQGAAWPDFNGTGSNPFVPRPDVWVDAESGMNHDKVMILDEGRTASDPTLITGSFNWSNAANTVNDENSIIFHSQRVANLYEQYFAERYRIAGGTADRTVSVADAGAGGFAFAAPFPNPAVGGRRVTFALTAPSGVAPGTRASLRLYSVAGRLVRTLVDGPASPGATNVAWDGKDAEGRTVAPGVYLARATVGAHQAERKVVLIP